MDLPPSNKYTFVRPGNVSSIHISSYATEKELNPLTKFKGGRTKSNLPNTESYYCVHHVLWIVRRRWRVGSDNGVVPRGKYYIFSVCFSSGFGRTLAKRYGRSFKTVIDIYSTRFIVGLGSHFFWTRCVRLGRVGTFLGTGTSVVTRSPKVFKDIEELPEVFIGLKESHEFISRKDLFLFQLLVPSPLIEFEFPSVDYRPGDIPAGNSILDDHDDVNFVPPPPPVPPTQFENPRN